MKPDPLKHLHAGWYAAVMGLTGLSLAWHRAVPALGDGAANAALALGVLAAAAFTALGLAGIWRAWQHPEAWAEDLRHPVRHPFVAALPISVVLLATVAVACGMTGPVVLALWWAGALTQLAVTTWVLARWWRAVPGVAGAPGTPGALGIWAGVTPALFIPVVGNVLVPLAGVPLGQVEWAAAQFGVGLLFWPLITALLLVRIALHGLWPARLLPASFILVAPPSVVGLSALQFGAPPLVGWALWGMALFSLLWVLALLRRIADQPFGLAHWGMSFPMAAFTALTLRLAATGGFAMLGLALLAATTLLVAALALATLRGLRDGTLLAPETVPIAAAA